MTVPSITDGDERPQFDAVGESYDEQLEQGLKLSGEDSTYFAEGRVRIVQRQLAELGVRPTRVLDYGCGTGATVPLLHQLPGVEHVVAVDESPKLVELGRRTHGSTSATFHELARPVEQRVDLAYCNGVFHHIDPPDRRRAMAYIADALRPGGLFAFWENNPWNPGTRLIMRRIPFDRDAIPLSPRVGAALLRSAGFEVLRAYHAFFFPGPLKALRPLERAMWRLPVGGQYLLLARKPD